MGGPLDVRGGGVGWGGRWMGGHWMEGHPLGLELTEAAEGYRAACTAVVDIGVGGIEKSARGCDTAPSEDGGLEEHAISRLGARRYMSGFGILGDTWNCGIMLSVRRD
jgi:hypothetical protein